MNKKNQRWDGPNICYFSALALAPNDINNIETRGTFAKTSPKEMMHETVEEQIEQSSGWRKYYILYGRCSRNLKRTIQPDKQPPKSQKNKLSLKWLRSAGVSGRSDNEKVHRNHLHTPLSLKK